MLLSVALTMMMYSYDPSTSNVELGESTAPPSEASWYIGPSLVPDRVLPAHFTLPVSDWHTLAGARLLPNVLVVLDQDARTKKDSRVRMAAGTQLFRLGSQPVPTYCTIKVKRSEYACLTDSDADGRLDTLTPAFSPSDALPLLWLSTRTHDGLAEPVSVTQIPREQCACKFQIRVNYTGRLSMSRRDVGFSYSILSEDGTMHVKPTVFLLDSLPSELEVQGARLTNLGHDDKTVQFDLISDLPQRPYDPVYIRAYTNWGF